MRTFEVPAVGSCMLTEDTPEHREIFGQDGEAVVYFNTVTEMVEKTHWLLHHDQERQRLAQNAHLLITQGQNTYGDRLKTMLSI
jgi:spore maturation protein CgeB